VNDRGPSLTEARLRAEIEEEVRTEFDAEQFKLRTDEQDRRVTVLAIQVSVIVAFALPLAALILGGSFRLGRWAAGY
jgi:hypothetical protein